MNVFFLIRNLFRQKKEFKNGDQVTVVDPKVPGSPVPDEGYTGKVVQTIRPDRWTYELDNGNFHEASELRRR